ncbi:MAG: DMT family transporter [Bosea sp.]|nr:DMT family transporter [Bosea sp. (in: a-proteobacteria)]MCP4732979.1 DMT family transporter [Bosea sp. (in: a-proteobacteria)]
MTPPLSNPYLLLVLTMLFWGGNSVAGRLAVGEISPIALTSLRWIVVGTVMFALYRRQLRAYWPELQAHKPYLLAMGIIGFTAYNSLIYWAAHSTTALNINIITAAMPAMILVGALMLFGQPVRPLQWAGMIVSVLGVAVVATKGELATLGQLALNTGDLLVLVATAFYATYSLLLRNRPPVPSIVFFAAITPVAALSSLVLLGAEMASGQFVLPTSKGWLVLAYVAVFPSLLAQIFFIRAVEIIGSGRAGMFANLVPVFGSSLAILILGEAFAAYHAAALLLVIMGILIAEYRHSGGK